MLASPCFSTLTSPLGLAAIGAPTFQTEVQELTSALPTGYTFTRADAIATYRDSNGDMRQIGANDTPRFDHDIDGNPRGLLLEPAATNLVTTKNYSPPDSSGYTVTGTATVTRVFDSTSTSAGKLSNISDNWVMHISGGTSGGTVTIGGTTGATGVFSASMHARAISGPIASFGITPDAAVTEITGSVFSHHKAENLTATATTDKIVITLPAGFSQIRVLLSQLESGPVATSPILVNGATATRAKEFAIDNALDTRDYFDINNGGIMVEMEPLGEATGVDPTGAAFVAGDAAFPSNAYYTQSNQTSGNMSVVAKGGNNLFLGSTNDNLLARRINPLGIAWDNGNQIQLLSGPGMTKTQPMTTPATGIDRLSLGAFLSNGGHYPGWYKKITFFTGATPTLNQMAAQGLGANAGYTEKAIINGGQSLAANLFQAPINGLPQYGNAGQRAVITELDDAWGTSTRNWYINGAIGGTFITSWRGSGDSITKWKEIARAYLAGGGTIEAIHWDQGESDMGNTTANFKLWYKEIFDDMRTVVGDVPVVITSMGAYKLNSTQTHYDNVAKLRLAHRELASENSWVHLAPEKYDLALASGDNVHLTDPSNAVHGKRLARKILDVTGETISGGVDGPAISGAVRTGTSVAVTVAHDGGTDFTPTTGIQGFRFFDDGVEIAVNAAVRTNATTITLTLASTPSGVERLDYCDGSLFSEDPTKFVIDNDSAGSLPLRAYTGTL